MAGRGGSTRRLLTGTSAGRKQKQSRPIFFATRTEVLARMADEDAGGCDFLWIALTARAN